MNKKTDFADGFNLWAAYVLKLEYTKNYVGSDSDWAHTYKCITETWSNWYLCPFQHPVDVDYRVMATFTELYTTLLGFVSFRLYSSLNLVYPPKVSWTVI